MSSKGHEHYMAKAGKYFPASVVDNNSPNKDFLIKCRVAGIDDSTPDEYLPWCKQISTLSPGTVMGIDMPANNEQVWIFFQEEDSSFRYVVGKNIVATSQLKSLLTSYPNGYATVDAMGTTMVVDTEKKTYQFIFPDGSGWNWSSNGGFNIIGSATLNVKGQNVNVAADEALSLVGKDVVLAGSSSLTLGAPSVSLGGNVESTGSAPSASNGASSLQHMTPATPEYPPVIKGSSQ